MTKCKKKQVRRLLHEIIYVSFVFIALTVFWFGPRRKMTIEKQTLGYQTTGLSKIQVTDKKMRQEITVENQDGKGDLMLVFQENTKQSTPIYYQVMTNGIFSEERCLTEDGAIYLLALEQNQKTTLEVHLWTLEDQVVDGTLQMMPVVYTNSL